jgi:hypothetical protein
MHSKTLALSSLFSLTLLPYLDHHDLLIALTGTMFVFFPNLPLFFQNQNSLIIQRSKLARAKSAARDLINYILKMLC